MNAPEDVCGNNNGHRSIASSRALIVLFLLLLVTVPFLQILQEWQRGEAPDVLRLFVQKPTKRSIAEFERRMEESSIVTRVLRPWMQAVQFFALHDGGAKVSVGRSGWLFYTPGINAITQRRQDGESHTSDVISAVTAYRNALAARGIRLIVLPVPNKESVYPQWFSRSSMPPTRIINPETRAFFEACDVAGVEVVDLFARFREMSRDSYYLRQDTHWSPHGMDVAAKLVAEHIGIHGATHFDSNPVKLDRYGDLIHMLQSPTIFSWLPPEHIETTQFKAIKTDEASVLVLGDSFSRIFENDEPGDAGFITQLAHHLGQPATRISHDGGASTLVRQELFRHPNKLANIKVVVWEFTERDLRLGIEGWQIVPLPPIAK